MHPFSASRRFVPLSSRRPTGATTIATVFDSPGAAASVTMRKGALHSRLDGTATTAASSRRFPIGWSAAEEQRQAMVRQGSPPHEDKPGRHHRPPSQQETRDQGGAGAAPTVPAAVPVPAAAGNSKNGRWSTRVCNEPGCSTVPSYGAPGTKRKFCKLHAKAGMINVASKKCSHENCGKVSGTVR